MKNACKNLLLSVVPVLALLVSGCHARHPSDAKLINVLTNNFVAFSSLVAEIKADPSVQIVEWDGRDLRVNRQIAATRYHTSLGALCSAIGCDMFIVNRGSGAQIQFYLSIRGLSVSGSGKGVVYQEAPPHIVVSDTDREHDAHKPFTVCREVYPHWYIFYSQ